jgi:hypothetical protein
MDQWVGSQRAFAMKAFYKTGDSLTAAQWEFRRHYNVGRHARIPSCHAIKIWVKNFKEAGSALKKNHQEVNELKEPQRTLKQFGPQLEGAHNDRQGNMQQH